MTSGKLMVKALIVDDEPKNIRILHGLLSDFCPQVRIAGEAQDAATAVSLIRSEQPDLLFLDIEMPYGNGFDLLDQVMPVNFEIIFITAFNEYTLKAFRYSALDYLLKPVSIDELKEAVQKAEAKLQQKQINQQLENLLLNLKRQTHLQKIAVPWMDGLIFMPVADIIRFEAKGGYSHIFAKDQRKFLCSKTIREYEDILPEEIFYRIHNSHLINLNHIRKYHKGRGGIIEMEDGAMIEVASRRKDEFLAKFGYK